MFKNIVIAFASVVISALALYPVFMADSPGYFDGKIDATISSLPEAQISRWFFSQLQAGDLDSVKATLDQKMIDEQFTEKFRQIAGMFPRETPKNVKFIGFHTTTTSGVTTKQILSQYEFSTISVTTNLVLQPQGGDFVVLGFHLTPLQAPLEDITKFEFGGQGVKHYLVFGTAILLLVFDIYVLVLCIRTPELKRKWLWIIFILVGVGQIRFNWLDGAFYFFSNRAGQSFASVFVSFPVAAFSKIAYQPFIVSLGLPVGAIMFLVRRKKQTAPAALN